MVVEIEFLGIGRLGKCGMQGLVLGRHRALALLYNARPRYTCILTHRAVMERMDTSEEDDFQERSKAFVNWLKENGASISAKIKLDDLRQQNAGRGVGMNLSCIGVASAQEEYVG